MTLHYCKGFESVLVVTYIFSKFPIVVSTNDHKASTVAKGRKVFPVF